MVRDIFRATALTRRWNGYQNKSQHKKLTLQKNILRRSCRDSNPRLFDHEHEVRRSTTELSSLPKEVHIILLPCHVVVAWYLVQSAVCVCVCVCARARARVRACVRACMLACVCVRASVRVCFVLYLCMNYLTLERVYIMRKKNL